LPIADCRLKQKLEIGNRKSAMFITNWISRRREFVRPRPARESKSGTGEIFSSIRAGVRTGDSASSRAKKTLVCDSP